MSNTSSRAITTAIPTITNARCFGLITRLNIRKTLIPYADLSAEIEDYTAVYLT